MSDLDVAFAAKAAGWNLIGINLYDEEGIDGDQWIGPNGEEYVTLLGEIPPQVRLLFDLEYAEEERKLEVEREQRRKELGRFADFLDDLLHS